ncbi:MAG TPA: hypothetical protein VE262_03125 [Blastocatellia bacterium]|nr:hypothetical protein [Blastocatellia bacterium]
MMMQSNLITRSVGLILIGLVLTSAAFGQDKRGGKAPQREYTEEELLKMSMKAKINPPSSLSFRIALADHDPNLFTILLSDPVGKTVSSAFDMSKLAILSAILTEAKNFSQTAEGVGAGKPLITRFFDKQLPSVIVDVSKTGDTSRFYITLKGLTDFVTIDAGFLRRSDKKANPYYFEIINRVESAKDGKWQ